MVLADSFDSPSEVPAQENVQTEATLDEGLAADNAITTNELEQQANQLVEQANQVLGSIDQQAEQVEVPAAEQQGADSKQ